MLIPLIFVALTASPPPDLTVKVQRELEESRQHYLDEASLLNQQIKLPPLSSWDSTQNAWGSAEARDNLSGNGDKAKLRVVHLWAHWCEPCKKEFLLLKDIDQNMRSSYKNDIDFIYISVDTSDPEGMQKYMQEFNARMPAGLKYGDSSRELTVNLEQALPQGVQKTQLRDLNKRGRQLPLPLTIVLDRDDVVRQAVVGSIEGRRGELVNGVARIYRWAKDHEAFHGAPCAKGKVVARRTQAAPVQ